MPTHGSGYARPKTQAELAIEKLERSVNRLTKLTQILEDRIGALERENAQLRERLRSLEALKVQDKHHTR